MKTLLLVAAFIFSTTIFAGPGHGHSHGESKISKEKSLEVGKLQIQRLIKDGKLPSSWSKAKHSSTERKTFKDRDEWVVVFKNKDDEKNEKLYIFLTLSGDFVAANFTGK